MKKIIILLLVFCGCNLQRGGSLKYHIGDIVYLKPDSASCVIMDTSGNVMAYRVFYNQKGVWIDEKLIYGLKESK